MRHREVVTAAELKDACDEEFPSCQVLLMAAAVGDFKPSLPSEGKLKRSGRERLQIELEPNPDILAGLAAQRREGQTLVGFAAEHGERAIDNAREKLARKGVDAVVVNDISRTDIGFDAEANEVTILIAACERSAPAQDGLGPPGPEPAAAAIAERHVARAAKAQVAGAILDAVEEIRARRRPAPARIKTPTSTVSGG